MRQRYSARRNLLVEADVEEEKNGKSPLNEGYTPVEKGWIPGVRGGYQPATSEGGTPPTGGSGGKEPEKK